MLKSIDKLKWDGSNDGIPKICAYRTAQVMDIYNYFHEPAEAYVLGISHIEKHLAYAKETGNSISIAYDLAPITDRLTDMLIDVESYEEGIKILTAFNADSLSPGNQYRLAKLYVLNGDIDKGLKFSKNTLLRGLNKPANRTDYPSWAGRLIQAYNNYGLIAKLAGEDEIAIKSFRECLKLIEDTGTDRMKPVVMGNLGTVYLRQGKMELANRYLSFDYEESLIQKDFNSHIGAALALGNLHILQNNYLKSIELLSKLEIDFEDQMDYSMKLKLYNFLAVSYKQLEHYKKSSLYNEKLNDVRIKENNENLDLVRSYSKMAFKSYEAQRDTEIEMFNQTLIVKEKQERESRLLLIGGALFIIFMLLLARAKYRKKIAIDLLKQKLQIQEEIKNVSLLSHELITKKDFSVRLIGQLNRLETISKSELRNVEFFIKNELKVKSSIANLQNQMGELSSSFYRKLKMKHSNLTENDIKLAGMVVMKMSNKEISISKNISSESTKKAKSRLKKKLSISSNQDIVLYLEQYL
jgi:tetratricopeptide (TPR) repeat protein